MMYLVVAADLVLFNGKYKGVISFPGPPRPFSRRTLLMEYRIWYRDSVIHKIKERSWKYEGVPGMYIDIVNVINATSVHWAADRMVRLSSHCYNLISHRNLTVRFFSAVSHWRPNSTPLDCTQSKRSTICFQLWWVLSSTYWRGGIADLTVPVRRPF